MAKNLPFRLTLASGSQGRRYLLEREGYHFDIRPAHVDEPTEARYASCRQYVQEVAWLKAAAVAHSNVVDNGIILAADTVGWIDQQVIGKPTDRDDAKRILKMLSGRIHELWTGVCLWRVVDHFQYQYQEISLVKMKELSEDEIESYLDTRQWEGCSGAYAISEEYDPYLEVVRGSLSNVIGLPMESLDRAFDLVGRCKAP